MNDLTSKLLDIIQEQLKSKQAGTVAVPSELSQEPGTWVDDYFIADCLTQDDTAYIVAVKGSLQGLSLLYIQAPHDILGALIGRSGENAKRILGSLEANGFAADRISFKDASLDPIVFD